MRIWYNKHVKNHMKKALLIAFLFAFFLLTPRANIMAKAIFKSFGGKVILITKSGSKVICTGSGMLSVLSSNLTGATQIGTSQFEQTGIEKGTGTAGGLYKSIPYYTENPSKQPKIGGWILGKANIVPNFSKCHINLGEIQIPIPVFVTKDYNVSKK